jgi:curved DNA-binding protein CbpA
MPETYYEILGIPRKVSKEDLAHSYLSLALKWHPERHPNDPEAERKYTRVAEAFCVLIDPKSRFVYDRALKENPAADEPMRVPIEMDAAHTVLREMLEKYIENRLMLGGNPDRICNDLVEQQKCPPQLAKNVVDAAVHDRKTRIRAAGMKMMWHGLGVFTVGVFVTAGSFLDSNPGGAFMLWYGPIIFGACHLGTALWHLSQGTEPPRPYSLREL